MAAIYDKLNNPAWYSLTETQKHFAIGYGEIKCYQKNIVSFAAYQSGNKDVLKHLDQLITTGDFFFIIGDLAELPLNYKIESVLPSEQMICTSPITINPDNIIQKLDAVDEEQMNSLVNLVHPGYYKPGTRLMGNYYGIRHNGELVSMAGERMRMDGYTEISAVVTHPEYTGRKYAQQLVAHVANKNLKGGTIPFLHTAVTNERAIKIYKHLGFVKRRIIDFIKIKRIA